MPNIFNKFYHLGVFIRINPLIRKGGFIRGLKSLKYVVFQVLKHIIFAPTTLYSLNNFELLVNQFCLRVTEKLNNIKKCIMFINLMHSLIQ